MRSRTWWAGITSVGVTSMVLLVFAITAPMTIRSRKKADLTQAVFNMRQIGVALREFDASYESFPSVKTAMEVKLNTGTPLNLAIRSSNDFFRQLYAADIAVSEGMFYARTRSGRKPDNSFEGANAIEKNECAFSYVTGLSSESPGETPVVLFPLIPGQREFDYKLSKKYFDGKAVILRVDGSVTSLPIDKSGKVYLYGKDLFDPSQPFWQGKAPDVKWPE